MTSLLLVRHGHISSPPPRRYIGRTDLPLTRQGREQMEQLATVLPGLGLERLFTSPLSRCRHSAQVLAEALDYEPELHGQFTEIDLGAWEGLTIDEVRQRYPGAYEQRGRHLGDFRPPQGESFQDVLERAWPAVREIMAAGQQQVAVVTHAGVIRVLVCHLLGMPLSHLFRLESEYGRVTMIRSSREGIRLAGYNLPWQGLAAAMPVKSRS